MRPASHLQSMLMRFETLAVHAGAEITPNENEPITHPIVMSTVFERGQDAEYKHDLSYTRADNPNRRWLERALAQLEGGEAAAAFSSGSAATMAVFQALGPGDHVIATDGFYGTNKLLNDVLRPWGLESSLVNTGDLEAVRKAIKKNTKLVWVETPSNPRMRVTDIAAVAEIAHKAGAMLLVDNTVGTPMLQRCFDLGADLILHSGTKYLGGHTDVLAGAIVSRKKDDYFARIHHLQGAAGAVPSPFDCWLLHRGMKTLSLRVPVQSANALKIASVLSSHSKIESVLYPGLPSHPGHDISAKQMRGGFGGLLSFLVKGGRAEALRLTSYLELIHRATSLGGTETSIDHRESVEPPGYGTPANLLRLSCGIEHADDLIDDLRQALEKL
jgi:cystathionine gamma-synthase